MERSAPVELVDQGLSTRAIASLLGCSQSNVRHWLRSHGLRTRHADVRSKNLTIGRRCSTCGETDPAAFYGNHRRMCRQCSNAYTAERHDRNRQRALVHLGGRCTRCGYDEHGCALAIHHLDPSKKDVSFNSWRGWSWARIEAELDGCVLLCLNCHAVEHHVMGL